MSVSSGPEVVVWDTTYACPLRCSHCYSESGRRPSRQLSPEDMLRVADALISLGPRVVALSGGEPLLVKGLFEVAGRLSRAGVKTAVYTSGWVMEPWMADGLAQVFDEVIVSLDGATAQVHDRIRGRRGSFDRALSALTMLSGVARERRRQGLRPLWFGIDCVVVRSNLPQLEEFCTAIAPRFPELRTITFNAAVPEGLASRPEFCRFELLDDDQVAWLTSPAMVARLRELAPEGVRVHTTDNQNLVMRPDRFARGVDSLVMQIEPDGDVRALPVYEGTVGNILQESPLDLWHRGVSRLSDPFVVETLSAVRTMQDWAEAVRRLDYRFGSAEVRSRIDRRSVRTNPPEFTAPVG
ncbi:radical SAM/SPASM domain-containing protein [Streptomyces mashuensis]|uniref:Radical SAM/SPASM domain-containing protein n=1 Tax=Streptomyces mashuensis TaxID=33904 RepID=A0A919EEQ6_9ACTN|nr:radical SAM protein [Streptomyces mashuensis]GHF59206.1 radical SAM/SPASM domain-containing protein [Streptomyces mashuensis]